MSETNGTRACMNLGESASDRLARIRAGSPVMWDWHFPRWPVEGADPDTVFRVTPCGDEGRVRLTAHGYGEHGSPKAYGGGSIYTYERCLVEVDDDADPK